MFYTIMASYFVIHDTDTLMWDILCSSYEQALGHVLHKINQMNKEFRKQHPQYSSVDPEYTPGVMEDDLSIDKYRDARGTMVANFSDYTIQFFVKEVKLIS